MRLPTDQEILALHERHAPSAEALDSVYTHCVIVCGIAEQLHDRSGHGRRHRARAGRVPVARRGRVPEIS